MTQPTNIEKEFHQKFSNRFLEIARLADEGDDVGYGQELAKLEIDIRDHFVKTISERDAIARQEEREAKDNAYYERNLLVQALSKVFPAYLSRHDENDESWEKDWMNIVYIEIPVLTQRLQNNEIVETMQVSWHIHDSEKHLFSHLLEKENDWDGHDTEEKYARLKAIKYGN